MSESTLSWPKRPDELAAAQRRLGALTPPAWTPMHEDLTIGGCFVCFPRGSDGVEGEPAWAAAVSLAGGRAVCRAVVEGQACAAYEAGLLALREGALLEAAVRALAQRPDVLLVDATGRDHPRRCGLAYHLGATLDLPSVGVTHRPLVAVGPWPPDEPAASSPLLLDGSLVGFWVRSRRRTRPLAVHAAWRTTPEAAREVFLLSLHGSRTPEPLRHARRLAREARQAAAREL